MVKERKIERNRGKKNKREKFRERIKVIENKREKRN